MLYKYLFYVLVFLFLVFVVVIITYGKRKYVIVRLPKPYKVKIGIDNYFGHIYGLLGIVALALTIVGLWNAYKNITNDEVVYVVNTIVYSLVIIIVSYIIASAFFTVKISKLKAAEYNEKKLDSQLRNQYVVNRYQSELFHSAAHYQRNVVARIKEFNIDDYSQNDVDDIKNRFHNFLVILTSNLQSYFSFITHDNCSVTIKKVTDDKEHVETMFRDPVNFNRRKKSDEEFRDDGGKYKINRNTAFKIITDPTLTNNFYYDDKLSELADAGNYHNNNPKWKELYNATIVVPISILLKSNYRDIIGFLTVDNKQGGLADDSKKEFLFGIADLLYNVLLDYSNFIKFVEQNKNGRK